MGDAADPQEQRREDPVQGQVAPDDHGERRPPRHAQERVVQIAHAG
jgi:hypothetical protein